MSNTKLVQIGLVIATGIVAYFVTIFMAGAFSNFASTWDGALIAGVLFIAPITYIALDTIRNYSRDVETQDTTQDHTSAVVDD